jgi:hypothetical protein
MRLISKSAFAKERKVHPSRVTQWIRDGRVTLAVDGRVDADASHARLDNVLDPTKGVRQDGNVTSISPGLPAQGSGANPRPSEPNGAGGETNAPQSGTSAPQSGTSAPQSGTSAASGETRQREEQVDWDARRRKDRADAQLAEMKALREAGALTSTAAVQKQAMGTARQVRNAMLSIPDRLAQVLDPANPQRAHKLLTDEIAKALRELRTALEDEAEDAARAPAARSAGPNGQRSERTTADLRELAFS